MSDYSLRILRTCKTPGCEQPVIGVFDEKGTLIAKDCLKDIFKHVPRREYFLDYLKARGYLPGSGEREAFDRYLDQIVNEEREAGR